VVRITFLFAIAQNGEAVAELASPLLVAYGALVVALAPVSPAGRAS
jgi:hypothetical protein